MAKLYKKTDRVTVKIHDVTVKLAPLNLDQKTEISDMMARGHIKKDYTLLQKAISSSIKYSVKEIHGVQDAEDQPYALAFDADGNLTDECVSDLYNLEMHDKLVMVCSQLVKNIPQKFVDPDGVPFEGVEILSSKKEEPADPN